MDMHGPEMFGKHMYSALMKSRCRYCIWKTPGNLATRLHRPWFVEFEIAIIRVVLHYNAGLAAQATALCSSEVQANVNDKDLRHP